MPVEAAGSVHLKAVEIPVESVEDEHISESVPVNVVNEIQGIISETIPETVIVNATAVFTFFPEEKLSTEGEFL